MAQTSKQCSGSAAESLAEQYLLRQGLVAVTRNFRCKVGEIDLIMQHQQTLVFVEVRSRKMGAFATAAESVTRSKQLRIIRAAQCYLQGHAFAGNCRFDVLAIDKPSAQADPSTWQLQWIQDAFQT